ncbi:Glucose-1-phosphate cytidylyltransferase [Methylorubrum aminovorans]|uniref:Glucose-1-phosphate cytidylyltransferase n=1 Tax=Methylorubrum aminovorans TaxID=269069 RepID=A0ABQ4UCJ4_9HYPH|nr:glucose-1-phosphate cytidylyltransferase [Methylorubrum aminovorans]GJE65051.1 Glucose-1-phosphate cytidylyltransferase [Methylorubrum aminovorans]
MKAVILAGGLGTRLSEETESRPKPMVEVGGRPIIWHIMKMYSSFGVNEFVVCLGYKGYQITEFFANYYLHLSDVTIDIRNNSVDVHNSRAEDWRVTLVDTGPETMTGGRLKRVRDHVASDDFCMTYGDGVSDVDIGALIDFHKREGRDATVTAVRPPGRFGALAIEEGRVNGFIEKPQGDGSWINGGFFVLSPKVLDRIECDQTTWEREPLEGLARDGQLSAFNHEGFWQPMDTLRDKRYLEDLWANGQAKWKRW